ncbi:MAG: sulfatase-like hydrolase/transferase [Solirubrobacterales bacterium]|nr:sulfatase-like hydrolase/transferase [Solirubrobacterales bacterium]
MTPSRLTRRKLIRAGGATAAAGAAGVGLAGCFGGDDAGADSDEARNVLMIMTDSTRRDFVGAYPGHDRLAKTPNIDALAAGGLTFDHAVPEAMPTVPVRRALLTGVRSYPFRDWQPEPRLPPFPGWSSIPAARPTFPEVMSAAGVTTAYVTDNPFLIGPRFARFRGSLDESRPIYLQGEYRSWNTPMAHGKRASRRQIERYLLPTLAGTEVETRLREHVGMDAGRSPDELSGARVMRGGLDLLDGLKDRQPFFLGIDAFDPHEAFDPPATYVRKPPAGEVEPILPFTTPFSTVEQVEVTDEQVERIRELYAGELTWMDEWIGRILNRLDELGLAETTAVVFLSDHGIHLGEHGLLGKDNGTLTSSIHRIPYVIRDPEGRRAGERSGWFASTHDVAPTLLGFQGITRPGRMDGEDLSVMFGDGAPPARAVWTTCYANAVAAGDGRFVLIADNQGERRRLYDSRTDPAQERDVAARYPKVVDRLWDALVFDAGGTMPVFGRDGVTTG